MNHSSESWAALPGSRPLRVSATQTATTMPSSPGMKQIRAARLRQRTMQLQVAVAWKHSRRPQSSKRFHNYRQAPTLCASRAQAARRRRAKNSCSDLFP